MQANAMLLNLSAVVANMLGILAVLLVLAVLNGFQAPLIANDRAAFFALAIIGFVAASVIFMFFGEPEPPGVVMRVFVAFGSIVVLTLAALFERILQNAVDLKSENDLTV